MERKLQFLTRETSGIFNLTFSMDDAKNAAYRQPENVFLFVEFLDDAIKIYNGMDEDKVPSEFANVASIKRQTPKGASLPLISNIIEKCGKAEHKKFRRLMGEVSKEMENEEEAQRSKREFSPKAYLNFNLTCPNPNSKVIGTLFRFYAKWVKADESLKGNYFEQEVANALVEVLSTTPGNPLFDEVKNVNKLNWIKGSGSFSPKFRQLAGYK
ncbi:hypothetical protein C4559_06370 [Candidatus Microgenomates bacterium]|nr:MAG: hypothetical protein C4559_06370 [Candidatus Microgenomates bacterium]